MVNNVWTPEADQRLFLAILRVQNISVDYAAVAADLGTTTSAVTQRIFKLRKAARENSPSSSVVAQRNGRDATASTPKRQPRSSRAKTSKTRAKPSVKQEKPEPSNGRPTPTAPVARGGAVVEPKEEMPDDMVSEAEEHGTEVTQVPVPPTASTEEEEAAIPPHAESKDAAPKVESDGMPGISDADDGLLGGSFTMLDADDMCDDSPLSMRTVSNLFRDGCDDAADDGDGSAGDGDQVAGPSLSSSGRKRARRSVSPEPLPINRLLWGGSKKRVLAARKSATPSEQVDLADVFKDAPALAPAPPPVPPVPVPVLVPVSVPAHVPAPVPAPVPVPSVPVNDVDAVAGSSGTNGSLVLFGFGEESHRVLGGLAE